MIWEQVIEKFELKPTKKVKNTLTGTVHAQTQLLKL